MNLGPQFIPEEHHDWAWEISLRPELDKEYTTKSGEPYIIPGHLHFDESGAPYIASGACAGKHSCPPATQKMRERLAFERYRKASNL